MGQPTETPREGALAGLKVIELATEIQGPYAGLTLSEMGAEIVKVENRETGDTTRGVSLGRILGPDVARAEFGFYYFLLNRGKRSLSLDLKQPDGIAIMLRLLQDADVLLSNFRPGVLDRLGLGYPALSERFPRLVYAMATGWGPTGPWAQFPSRDQLAQAASGLMSKTGSDPGPPLPAGALIGDQSAAQLVVSAILAALYRREKTGLGQRVDVSLYGTLIAAQAYELFQTDLSGAEPQRAGNGHPFMQGAWGAFRTADGWLALCSLMQPQWPRFCEIINRPELAADPQWTDNTRNITGQDFRTHIEDAFLGRTTAEWMTELSAANVLATPVAGYQDVLDSEQALTNGYIEQVEHPEFGAMRMAGSPIGFSASGLRRALKTSALGADSDEILAEAGFDAAQVQDFRAKGVI